MERAETSWLASLPRHRAIVAVDIERSTSRTDTVKAEFRRKLYELFDAALRSAGILRRHRDRFVDRGDGVLALIHPVDQAPKALLLGRVVPALNQLLADYNAGRPQPLRVRAVVHAGEVSYDANGCFGEALDVAFRLLDAARVKKALKAAADPLLLVISEEIYRTVVRHGYSGIDRHAFRRLVRVQIAGNRYPGWIHASERPAKAAPLTWPATAAPATAVPATAVPATAVPATAASAATSRATMSPTAVSLAATSRATMSPASGPRRRLAALAPHPAVTHN